MLSVQQFLLTLVLLPLVDAPWLWLSSTLALPTYEKIQGGRPLKPQLLAALPVYLALAYLHSQQTTITGAAAVGAAVYAVYDFTVLTLFQDFSLWLAIADTLWGGALFALIFYIMKALGF
jgi:uncharacterized membrane protein